MDDVIELFEGRVTRGKTLPRPAEYEAYGEDIETVRLQVMPGAKAVHLMRTCR